MMAGIHDSVNTQNRKPNTKKKNADLFGDERRAIVSTGTRAIKMANVSPCGGYAAHRSSADTAAAIPHQRFLLPRESVTVTKPSGESGSSSRSATPPRVRR